MFKQLHEAFSVGIKECMLFLYNIFKKIYVKLTSQNIFVVMEQFDNYLQHLQPMQDSTEEILNKFSGFRQHLDSILVKHRNTVTDTMLETRKDVKSLEILLSRQVQDTIRTEVCLQKCGRIELVARSASNVLRRL